jgi:hypothetical protein
MNRCAATHRTVLFQSFLTGANFTAFRSAVGTVARALGGPASGLAFAVLDTLVVDPPAPGAPSAFRFDPWARKEHTSTVNDAFQI